MKQVICVRTDLGMTGGKVGSQCAHATKLFLLNKIRLKIPLSRVEEQWLFFDDDDCYVHPRWEFGGMKCITVAVYDFQHLWDTHYMAKLHGLESFMVWDHTLCQWTCCAIGPDVEEKFDLVTGHLQLFTESF